jgi:hypothetical protein
MMSRRNLAFAALGGGAAIVLVAVAMRRKAPAEPASSFTPVAASEIPRPFHRVHPPRPGTLGLPEVDAGDAGKEIDAAGDGGVQQFDTSYHPGDGPLVRDLDKVLLAYIGAGKVTKNGWNRDVFPKASYRVDMFRDSASGLVTKLWLDTNRNGKWDEMWGITASEVYRKWSMNDDENYREFTYLKMGRWAPSNER